MRILIIAGFGNIIYNNFLLKLLINLLSEKNPVAKFAIMNIITN
jgi:hypothetical protein